MGLMATFTTGAVVGGIVKWLYDRQTGQGEVAGIVPADGGDAEVVESDGTVLLQIRGIGPVYAKRLGDAGISTLTQLANTPPEQIRDIVDASTIDPEDWITQAQALASA